MSDHKTLDELEIVLRAGSGVAVICEGKGREDEFYYSEWFSHLARRVTFYGQNGWQRVQEAVDELRRRGTPVPVVGLLDRDFTSDEEIARQFESTFDGRCYRLPRYDIESYLLDPNGWLRVLQRVLWRREGRVPDGWGTFEAIEAHIHGYYRDALPVAAHNWTVHKLARTHAARPGFRGRDYLLANQALQHVEPEGALAAWACAFGADVEAREIYRERLEFLQAHVDQLDVLRKHVSGKLVFHELHRNIPARRRPDRIELADRYLDELADLYPDKQPKPPPDMEALILHILARFEAEARPRPA